MEEVRWTILGERVEESRELVRVCVMPASTAATNVPNMKHACNSQKKKNTHAAGLVSWRL